MTASNAPDIGISIMKEQDYHLENVTFKKIEDKVNHSVSFYVNKGSVAKLNLYYNFNKKESFV